MKKDRAYSTRPLKLKKKGRDTLNPFFSGKTPDRKTRREVVAMTKLLIINVFLLTDERSQQISTFMIRQITPIIK